MKTLLALTAVCGFAAVTNAAVVNEVYGTAVRPGTMGGGSIVMTPAPFNGSIFSDVSSTPDGLGGNINFSVACSVRQIGSGWATWSGGYTGNAFYTNGAASLTLSYAAGVKGVQVYAEPNPFAVFSMSGSASDGSTGAAASQSVSGSSGASGWGFYSSSGADISSATIRTDDGFTDFAVGDLATSRVPAPASLALLGVGGLLSGRRRRA